MFSWIGGPILIYGPEPEGLGHGITVWSSKQKHMPVEALWEFRPTGSVWIDNSYGPTFWIKRVLPDLSLFWRPVVFCYNSLGPQNPRRTVLGRAQTLDSRI